MKKDSLFNKLKVDGSYTSKEVSILSSMINESGDLNNIKEQLTNKKSNFAKFVMSDISKANIYSLATPNNQTKLVELYNILNELFPNELNSIKDKIIIKDSKIVNYNNKFWIQLIQTCLNILNNKSNNDESLKIDWKFGSKTFVSLLNYHLSSNLYKNSWAKIDGIVWKSTLDTMIAELKWLSNNEKIEETITSPVEQVEEISQYEDQPKNETLVEKKEIVQEKSQDIQQTPVVQEIEETIPENNHSDSLWIDNEESNEYYTRLLWYSKDWRKYLIWQDWNPQLLNVTQLPNEFADLGWDEIKVFNVIQDLTFVLDAYAHKTWDKELLDSFNEFIIQNNDKDSVIQKRDEIIKIIGDKYNKAIQLVDWDVIEDDFTLQSVFETQNNEERKIGLYKYVRENIGNYEIVSATIIENRFEEFFQNISDEDFTNFNKELWSNSTQSLTEKVLNASKLELNWLYFAINNMFKWDKEKIWKYLKELQWKLIEASNYFVKNDDVIRAEIEKHFAMSWQIPSDEKKKEIVKFTKSRIEYQYVTYNLKKNLFLWLDLFEWWYKWQDQELKMLSWIHGIWLFDISDQTKSLWSWILEFLMIEAIAFSVWMFTVWLWYWLIHWVAGLRYLNTARKLYSGSSIFRGWVKTVNFGMEGLMFYQWANLVHNIVESRWFFEWAWNLKEIGKTILFLKLMSGLGHLMNKVPWLALTWKEVLSSKVFKLSSQTLIEWVWIGLVWWWIDVYLEWGEWNIESFIDWLLLAIMVKSMSKPIGKIQKWTEKFIIKNLNWSVQLLVTNNISWETKTTQEIPMAKNKYAQKEIFEPASIVKPQLSQPVNKSENKSEIKDIQEQVIEIRINNEWDTVWKPWKVEEKLKESQFNNNLWERIQKVQQNKTNFVEAKEVGNMNFFTDVLNWSTTSVIVIKNSKWKQFILTSDFLPNNWLSKKSIEDIKSTLNNNKSQIWNIDQVCIVTTTDVSRVNIDFQKVVNEVNLTLWVNPNVKVVEYNSKDLLKAKEESEWKLSLDIYENWLIQITFSWKNLEFESSKHKQEENNKSEKKIEIKYDRVKLLKEVEWIVSQWLIIKDSVTKLEIIALKLKHKSTVNIKSITREINEIRAKLNKLTWIAEKVKWLDEIKIDNIDQLILWTKQEFDRINDRIREIWTEIIANSSNHYQLLWVPKNASLVDIKKARNELLRIFHQDFSWSKEIHQKINEAYEILKDSKKRMEYDMLII